MGCCGTKNENLDQQSQQHHPFQKNDEYCVAYVSKKDLRGMLERLSENKNNDQAVVNQLMNQFDQEIDLGLLLKHNKKSNRKLSNLVDNQYNKSPFLRQSKSTQQSHLQPSQKDIYQCEKVDQPIQTDDSINPHNEIIHVVFQPAVEVSTGEQAILVMSTFNETKDYIERQHQTKSRRLQRIDQSSKLSSKPSIAISSVDSDLYATTNQHKLTKKRSLFQRNTLSPFDLDQQQQQYNQQVYNNYRAADNQMNMNNSGGNNYRLSLHQPPQQYRPGMNNQQQQFNPTTDNLMFTTRPGKRHHNHNDSFQSDESQFFNTQYITNKQNMMYQSQFQQQQAPSHSPHQLPIYNHNSDNVNGLFDSMRTERSIRNNSARPPVTSVVGQGTAIDYAQFYSSNPNEKSLRSNSYEKFSGSNTFNNQL